MDARVPRSLFLVGTFRRNYHRNLPDDHHRVILLRQVQKQEIARSWHTTKLVELIKPQ